MSDPAIEPGVERDLAPDVIVVWRIGYAIGSTVLSIGLLVGAVFVFVGSSLDLVLRAGLLVVWAALAASLAAHAWFWPALRYRHESYRVLDRGIEIRRGVVWRRRIHVPRSRVQHTDVSRGPLERAFGLATLIVFTAGTEHASIALGGLTVADAFAIRDRLIGGGEDDAV